MEDKQVPERDFVREKIKNKPLNYRRILVKAAVAALCGVVFALTMGFTLYVLMPGLRRQWEESQPVSETQTVPRVLVWNSAIASEIAAIVPPLAEVPPT